MREECVNKSFLDHQFLKLFCLPYISVLVTTGLPYSSSTKSEVFSTKSEKTCQDLPPFPNQIDGAIGETVNGFPMICGGWSSVTGYLKECYTLVQNSWNKAGDMRLVRRLASSVLLANESLWILGGYNDDDGVLSTSELIDLDSTGSIIRNQPGPELPTSSGPHCSVLFTEKKAIVMGGDFGRKSHIFNMDTGLWTEGPQLQDSGNRHWTTCGRIRDKESNAK